MKDASGHGSNAKLTSAQGPAAAMPHFTPKPGGKGGGKGGNVITSNAQAAQALMSTLKSTQAPIHPAMVGRLSPNGEAI